MRSKSMRGNSAHFLALRRRLDLMGYQELPLGLDSAPLVQQMMEDLVSDTETLQENEQQINKLKEQIDILETQIEPLQSENTRLTRENVQLHQQLILAQEDSMRLENQHSAAAFELQAENRRLKLLNQKSSQHVKEMQAQIDQLKDRLQQSLAAPSMMKIPEVIEADPRKMRRGSRTGSSSRATSVISSESSFTAPNIAFDPNLFNTELDNLRKERDNAKQEAENAFRKMAELESVIKIRDDEIHRLGGDLQRETGRDGYMVSLRHKYEQQKNEIEKLRAQVRVVNPAASTRKPKPLVLTPPRTTVSIAGDEMLSVSDAQYDNRGHVTFSQAAPSMDSRMFSESSMTLDMSIDEYDDEEDVPEPRKPVVPEPMPGEARSTPVARETEDDKFKALKEKEKMKKQLLKEKLEKKKRKVREILKEKDGEIKKLIDEVDSLTASLEERDKTIAAMALDFSFIGDNVTKIVAEKDALIDELKMRSNEPAEIVVDTEEIDTLQLQLDEMKIKHEEDMQKKDQQIQQLQALAQTLTMNTSPIECKECIRLRQKLEDAVKSHQNDDTSAQEEIKKLRARASQLEVLIRASEEEKRDSTALDVQLQMARNQLTEREAQMERLRAAAAAQQNELKDCQRKLEEAGRKIKGLPDVEQRYRSALDQLRNEHTAMAADLKKKGQEVKRLGEKLTESQRKIRDLQAQAQKAREEAAGSREEAAFHRAKSEEVTQKMAEQSNSVIRDANAAVQHLQRQLQEKTKESTLYQKLLSEARRQLAPLTETTIPQFKQQIAKLQRDRDELVKRVKRLAQLAIYVEHSAGTTDSPDVTAFSAALHQLQDELKQYTYT